MNRTGEHGVLRGAVDKVQDTLAGLGGRLRAARVASADTFVAQAALGDRFEIEAAKIALRRSRSPHVRLIAKEMIQDHTTSTHQLEAALEMNETRGVSAPPRSLDARRAKLIEHLDAASDDRFDTTYLDQQLLAHEETLALMSSYRDKGDNPQLRSYAAGTAPVIERHRDRIKAVRAILAGKS